MRGCDGLLPECVRECARAARRRVKALAGLVTLIAVLLASCGTSVEGRKDLLDFIVDGSTTKEDVYLRLGTPSRTLENERILAYRINHNDSGYYVVASSSRLVDTPYSLILAFGDGGILHRHSLVEVQK
jgi:hypothetical protein